MRIGALEPHDRRTWTPRVATPAALLISKVHKIAERTNTPDRFTDKDAHEAKTGCSGATRNEVVLAQETGAETEARHGLRHGLLPFCYHCGMSKQIAVRLPNELVEFVDEIVGSGAGRSRAAVVTRALERERRRVVAARDAQILARTGPDPELAGLAEHAVGLPSQLA